MGPNRGRQTIRTLRAWFHNPDHPGWLWLQLVIGFLVVVSIVLLAVELAWEDDVAASRELDVIDDIILYIFVLELTLRVALFNPPEVVFYRGGGARSLRWHAIGRLRFLLRPLNLADALAVLAVIPALRGLRALRLLRLLRGIGVFRYANPFTGLARAFVENRLPFVLAFSFLLLTVLMFGTTIYMVEARYNSEVNSLADGYWWAIVTITTVGFGDIAPVTAVGRTIAAILMIIGMFTLALFAGIVGNTMLNVVMAIRQEEFRMGGYVNHLVVCGYDPAGRRLLDELVQEVGQEYEGRLVVFAPGDRPLDLPVEFAWVQGDPTKESELEKVRLAHAAILIIVGSRAVTPQQADATTILTAFTARNVMRHHKVKIRRDKFLYMIAEILDSENVDHARTAGCDEVIETTRLGFSLLAHATSTPGSAAILSEVAARGKQSLYVGLTDLPQASTFSQLAKRLKDELGILVVGIRDETSHDHVVNPAGDHPVSGRAEVLYFAAEPVLPSPHAGRE